MLPAGATKIATRASMHAAPAWMNIEGMITARRPSVSISSPPATRTSMAAPA